MIVMAQILYFSTAYKPLGKTSDFKNMNKRVFLEKIHDIYSKKKGLSLYGIRTCANSLLLNYSYLLLNVYSYEALYFGYKACDAKQIPSLKRKDKDKKNSPREKKGFSLNEGSRAFLTLREVKK